ncbi:MAG: winged helix-turn-helix domain-containing protein, partial [Proteobacteria bacterium]|nr:winged helix-turn-helix domain-containing protein [Pseudomonadota bacterium]
MTAETSNPAARIDLAHAADFTVGDLAVRPATREVTRQDGAVEVAEPRVMQVLVALARADGGVISRDDLTQSCWEGRIVGEDAINRVISRLRRIGETIGQNSFRVETVTKVGYRLVERSSGAVDNRTVNAALRPSRRTLIAGAGSVGALAIGVGIGWHLLARDDTTPASVAPLIAQATLAMRQDSPDGNAEAIGFYRQVVDREPNFADGWGGLALAYAVASHQSPEADTAQMRDRARAAIDRANQLRPGNAYAGAALALLAPRRRHWLDAERALRAALADHLDDELLFGLLGSLLMDVGRETDSAAALVKARQLGTPTPLALYQLTSALWYAGRLEEADRASDEMIALYPRHVGVWFVRFYFLLFNGRGTEAIALGENRAGRPPGIPDGDFDIVLTAARAVVSRAPADIDRAMAAHLAAARRGAGYAQNAMKFAAIFGRLDDAFAMADAIYFNRGFAPGSLFFSGQQASYLKPDDRLTEILFSPPLAPMRA